MKSLLFKRGAGAKSVVSSFSRQVAYLSTGIATTLVALPLYHLANASFYWYAEGRSVVERL